MTLNRLNSMRSGESPISIHNERDMLWDGTLPKCSDQELLEVGDGELDRRGGEEPLAETGQMYRVRHDVRRV